jgi:hypothetical protein
MDDEPSNRHVGKDDRYYYELNAQLKVVVGKGLGVTDSLFTVRMARWRCVRRGAGYENVGLLEDADV